MHIPIVLIFFAGIPAQTSFFPVDFNKTEFALIIEFSPITKTPSLHKIFAPVQIIAPFLIIIPLKFEFDGGLYMSALPIVTP